MLKHISTLLVLLGLAFVGCERLSTNPVSPSSVTTSEAADAKSTLTFWLSTNARNWHTGLTVAWPFTNDAAGDLQAQFGVAKDPALSYMFTASPSKSLRATFTATVRLIGAGTLFPWDGAAITPNARLFIFCEGNSWDVNHPEARWWATRAYYPLVQGDWTTIAALTNDPSLWSDADGHAGSAVPTLFAAALSNVSSLGMTFGGQFYGHGAYGSTQTFQIQRIGVQ